MIPLPGQSEVMGQTLTVMCMHTTLPFMKPSKRCPCLHADMLGSLRDPGELIMGPDTTAIVHCISEDCKMCAGITVRSSSLHSINCGKGRKKVGDIIE